MNILVCQHPAAWDRYVAAHPHGGPFHRFGWKGILERVYNLSTFFLMAGDDASGRACANGQDSPVRGICALALLKSPGNKRRLISLPYLDVSGILADDGRCEDHLLRHALTIAQTHRVDWMELRQTAPLRGGAIPAGSPDGQPETRFDDRVRVHRVSTHKAGLRRDLPADSRQLLDSFKSKLRSQIKKALKNGLTHEVGGAELLPLFYDVFSRNMRDLGSPVHAYRWFGEVLGTFGEDARIVVVRRQSEAVAASLVLRFQNRLHNPWASSLRAHRRLGSNMLLYWAMLSYACDAGLSVFDFGRSSPGAGTFAFKRQWEARPRPLQWHYMTLKGAAVDPQAERLSFRSWKLLPIGLSRLLGPHIRRRIGL
jgi:serine/alanine adding enzyme